jgi:hypothetical protein
MTELSSFINSLTGLITAIATLVGGIATLISAWPKIKAEEPSTMPEKHKKPRRSTIISALFLLTVSSGIFFGRLTTTVSSDATAVVSSPLNVRLTTAAWEFFNKKDYRSAIAKAQECIIEFQGSANREQAELKGQSAPVPPTGKVSDEEKTVIFQRGLLNDVATCFFIQGRAAESLGLIEDAKRAYHQAETYPYARTWDSGGQFFWSPAQAATDRLSLLK